MEHSIEVVVAILGVLKSGAAYVPLDAATPKGRIATILKDISSGTDGRPPVAITQARLQSVISPNLADIFVLDADFGSILKSAGLGPAVRCYVGRSPPISSSPPARPALPRASRSSTAA